MNRTNSEENQRVMFHENLPLHRTRESVPEMTHLNN